MGIHKPHLPWIVPKRHFQHYDEGAIKLPTNDFCPWKMPRAAFAAGEIQSYTDMKWLKAGQGCNVSEPPDKVRHERRAYYASTTYADEQAGRLFDGLKRHGHWNNTVKHAPYVTTLPGPCVLRAHTAAI